MSYQCFKCSENIFLCAEHVIFKLGEKEVFNVYSPTLTSALTVFPTYLKYFYMGIDETHIIHKVQIFYIY